MQGKFFLGAAACKEQSMDIWQHIIRPGDVWGRFTLYLKQNGQAAVQREVVRSLRLREKGVFRAVCLRVGAHQGYETCHVRRQREHDVGTCRQRS